MGLSSRFALYARYRDGPDCDDDYRKAQAFHRRRRQRGTFAGLILAASAVPVWGDTQFRIAIYHTELSRDGPGLLLRDILSGNDEQLAAIEKVIRHIDADILVLGDVDYDRGGAALAALSDHVGDYPHRFTSMPNRGRQSGYDLDGDGRLGRADDAWGYGEFAGQGGMAILSKFPFGEAIDHSTLPWADLPGALTLPETHKDQPLSTTAHWEVPVVLPKGARFTLLSWHATAPVFDGPEDRNGRRNHDEAAFWLKRIAVDPPQNMIIAGFANLDPIDGDGRPRALNALLTHPALIDVRPTSEGGLLAGLVNSDHRGPAALDTVDWPEDGPGNLRVDYILPSRDFEVLDAGVFWPLPDQPLGDDVARASRHRVVWVDLQMPTR